jgi:hypothetical protein
LYSWGKQTVFAETCPTISIQDLKGRQQLDSSMSLTFFPELLLDNPKDFGPWDFLWSLGARSRGDVKNPRILEADWDYRVSTPIEGRRAKRGNSDTNSLCSFGDESNNT